MAITQQLARVTEAMLAECHVNVHRLHELCSGRALDPNDYLDLDWAPSFLEGAAIAAQVSEDLVAGIRLATTGEAEVNPEYREAAESVWEHPVSFLATSDVIAVNQALQALDNASLLTESIVHTVMAKQPPEARPVDPVGYLLGHYNALRGFYRQAAGRGLCTVMWWD